MRAESTTVAAYLDSLPEERRAALSIIRGVIRANLDPVYEEAMQYGMIGYSVPTRAFPTGYAGDPEQPLLFAGLASQKNHISIHLMALYGGGSGQETPLMKWFRGAWLATGRRLDLGKACIRCKKIEDVALDVLGAAIARVPARVYLGRYIRALGVGRSASKTSPKKR